MKTEFYRAGQLDQIFRNRAMDAGRPYTTAPLLEFSRPHKITKLAIENMAGRASAHLTKSEVAEWLAAMNTLAGKELTESVMADYALGVASKMASIA